MNWFEAFAFCIWDSGRLATEAEWNYAAAGGVEQREYPWSSPPDLASIHCGHASYDCVHTSCGNGTIGCQATDIIVVGTKPAGNGKWGQADLGGNVWEWVLDGYASYQNQCDNCANTSENSSRGIRGGGFINIGVATSLLSSYRGHTVPSYRDYVGGIRCVRTP